MTQRELNLKNANTFLEKYINPKLGGKKKIAIQEKESSKLMRLIGWFLAATKINTTFMNQYITTIGTTIYFPKHLLETISSRRFMEVVIHESVHAVDEHENLLLYKPSYLPELFIGLPLLILSIVLFGFKIWVTASILLGLCILCLLPVPKPGRFHWEIRAYSTSLAVADYFGYDQGFKDQIIKWVIGQLAGPSYYFTWPFKSNITKILTETKIDSIALHKEIKSFFGSDFQENVS
jgi:hypothetical protein